MKNEAQLVDYLRKVTRISVLKTDTVRVYSLALVRCRTKGR